MPERWQQAATSLRAAGEVTFEKARNFLLQEERKNGVESASVASMSRQRNEKNTNTSTDRNKKEHTRKYPCHRCGEFGHFRKDCKADAKEIEEKANASQSNSGRKMVLGSMQVRMNKTEEHNIDEQVHLRNSFHDSGTNDHIFNDPSWFTKLHKTDGSVGLPNGTRENVAGIGEVQLQENGRGVLFLKNAMYAPNLHSSYICEYSIMCDGFNVNPSLEETKIVTEGGDLIATAKRVNGLLEYTEMKPIRKVDNSIKIVNGRKNWHNGKLTECLIGMSTDVRYKEQKKMSLGCSANCPTPAKACRPPKEPVIDSGRNQNEVKSKEKIKEQPKVTLPSCLDGTQGSDNSQSATSDEDIIEFDGKLLTELVKHGRSNRSIRKENWNRNRNLSKEVMTRHKVRKPEHFNSSTRTGGKSWTSTSRLEIVLFSWSKCFRWNLIPVISGIVNVD